MQFEVIRDLLLAITTTVVRRDYGLITGSMFGQESKPDTPDRTEAEEEGRRQGLIPKLLKPPGVPTVTGSLHIAGEFRLTP
jgi:hypothetical protein